MIRSRSKLLIYGLLVAGPIGLLLSGCGEEQVTEAPAVARPVKTVVVGGAAAGGAKEYPGRVQASNQVDLSFRVGGPLTELGAKAGQEVKKGQVLARIDTRDYQIGLDKAKASHRKAEADHKRAMSLYEKEAIPASQLDQTRAARDVAKAALDDAQSNLDDTVLKAPFSARVGQTMVENFQDVRPKQAILSLVDVSSVEITVDIPERQMARATANAIGRLTASFSSAPDREFDLTIKEFETQADARTQTFQVTLLLEKPEGINILPGMTAKVLRHLEGTAGAGAAIVVPSSAVAADTEGKQFVWVVDEATMAVRRRGVQVGEITGTDGVQILEGLSAGERIASTGVHHLREGSKIRLMGQ